MIQHNRHSFESSLILPFSLIHFCFSHPFPAINPQFMYLFYQALNHFLGAEMCTCLIETFSPIFPCFFFFNCFIRESSSRHMKYTIPSHVGSFSDFVVCQKSLTETLSFLSHSCYPLLSFVFFSKLFFRFLFVSFFPHPPSTFPYFFPLKIHSQRLVTP